MKPKMQALLLKLLLVLCVSLKAMAGFAAVDLKSEMTVTYLSQPLSHSYVDAWVEMDVTVTNIGTATASNVVIQSPVPADWTNKYPGRQAIGNASDPVYNEELNQFTVEYIGPGASVSLYNKGQAQSAGIHRLTTTATTASDVNLSNNTYGTDINILPQGRYDLVPDVTISNLNPQAGEDVTFQISIHNNGPDVARGVLCSTWGTFSYTRWQFVSTDNMPQPLDTAGKSYMFGFGDIQPGQSAVSRVVLKALRPGEETIVFDFEASYYGQVESDMAGNRFSRTLMVQGFIPQFNLVPRLRFLSPTFQFGGIVAAEMSVYNAGPDASGPFKLSAFNFPEGEYRQLTRLTSHSNSAGRNLLYGEVPYLGPGESAKTILIFQVRPPLFLPHDISAYFGIESVYWDELDRRDNFASEGTRYLSSGGHNVDLQVSSNAPQAVVAHQPYAYNVTTTNHGPATAANVTVYNYVPPGLQVVSVSSATGSTEVYEGLVSHHIPALGSGQVAELTLTVVPTTSGDVQCFSGVSSQSYDHFLANNMISTLTIVDEGDGPVASPCAGQPDLTLRLGPVRNKGKLNKKNQQWQYELQANIEALNVGEACVSEPVQVQLYLSEDPVLDSGDLPVGQKMVKLPCPKPGKAPKAKKVNFKTKLPAGVNPTGLYVLGTIDGDNRVVECNEFNNVTLSQ